jgi:hypothetical protein
MVAAIFGAGTNFAPPFVILPNIRIKQLRYRVSSWKKLPQTIERPESDQPR